MAQRLIDATTLRAEFTGNFSEMWHYTGIWAMIDIAPTIDPVKHGKWTIEDLTPGTMRVACSECRISRWLERGRFYKYCPHCGARMDGEQK